MFPLKNLACKGLIEIHTFSFKNMHLKMTSVRCRPFFSRPQWVKQHVRQKYLYVYMHSSSVQVVLCCLFHYFEGKCLQNNYSFLCVFLVHHNMWCDDVLTYWGRVTHICVGNLTTIGPYNGLSSGRRQAIIWNNAGILLFEPWGTNFSEILIGIQTFSFKKMHLKLSSAKWRPFCLGLNVLSMLTTPFLKAFITPGILQGESLDLGIS